MANRNIVSYEPSGMKIAAGSIRMVAMIKPGPSGGFVRHSVEASRAPKPNLDGMVLLNLELRQTCLTSRYPHAVLSR